MEIVIQPSKESIASQAARLIARLINEKPTAVLGLATGSTPLPLYTELIRMHREDKLDFSRVTSFNLDEYVGLGPDHPASYNHFMHENLFKHINIRKEKAHVPNGLTADIPTYCREYEEKIQAAGGIDLQILGIGGDGHIGFNEPTSSFASRTRIKTLTQKTIDDNQRFFKPGEQVPRHVITMGVGTIMESRSCVLLAYGTGKSDAIAQMVEGPITSMCPASIMQMHRSAIVMIDEAAASKLKKADYYRYVLEHKPQWQQY